MAKKSNCYSGPSGPGFGCRIASFVKRVFVVGVVACLLAVLSVGLLAGYRFLTTHPYFALRTVEISGINRLTRAEIMDAAGIEIGKNCLDVNIGKVSDRLNGEEWIASASVKRKLPDTLSIHINERQPRCWIIQDGRLMYADEWGKPIAEVGANQFASLPLLMMEKDAVNNTHELRELLELVDRNALPFGAQQIAWIRFSLSRGVEIQLEAADVRIGVELEDWSDGLTRIGRSWADLRRRGELDNVRSLRAFGGKVWVGMRS